MAVAFCATGARRCAVWSSRATGTGSRPASECGGIEVVEAGHPSPDSVEPRGGCAAARARRERELRRRRNLCCLDLGRRLVARVAAAAGAHVRAEARGREFPDPPGRGHPRDQLRAQASVAAQRRTARRGGASGARGHVRDLRRARRRRRRHRVGPDGPRSDDAGRSAARSSRSTATRSSRSSRRIRRPAVGDAEAGRSRVRARHRASDRDGVDGAGGGRSLPATARATEVVLARRRSRRRSAGARPRARAAREEAPRVGRAHGDPVGRRNARRARRRRRPRRAQHGIPRCTRARARRRAGHLCARGRYRRHRRCTAITRAASSCRTTLQLGAERGIVARASYWRDTTLIVTLTPAALLLRPVRLVPTSTISD